MTRLGYGAMRIVGDGVWGPAKDPDKVQAVLKRLPELGVDFIDTADSYGPYVSEDYIARGAGALRRRHGRDQGRLHAPRARATGSSSAAASTCASAR